MDFLNAVPMERTLSMFYLNTAKGLVGLSFGNNTGDVQNTLSSDNGELALIK